MIMKQKHSKKPPEQKDMARQRIKKLFDLANETFSKDKALSDRYVTLARKIQMKYKVRFTSEQKRQFCRHCYSYLMPGKNCRVRTRGDNIVYYCLDCKRYNRFGKRGSSKKN